MNMFEMFMMQIWIIGRRAECYVIMGLLSIASFGLNVCTEVLDILNWLEHKMTKESDGTNS